MSDECDCVEANCVKLKVKETNSPSNFRIFLSQFMAVSAKNIIMLDLTMTLGYGSIVIAALLNAKSELNFTEEQASWFGSLPFFVYPIGSFVSGVFFEPLGRKTAMLIVNIPHLLFWVLCWRATEVWELKLAAVFCGLGAGFTTPCVTYTGETCQPKWRGVLSSFTGFVLSAGYATILSIGALTDWQTTALIGMMFPLVGLAIVSIIPESPVWLLCKGRTEEAEKSLSWLRGWTTPDMVKEEFQQLKTYSEKNIIHSDTNTADPFLQKWIKKLQIDALWHRKTLLPIALIIINFFFVQASGIFATRPYVVVIMAEFQAPIDSHQTSVISAIAGVLGCIFCTILIPRLGKRRLLLYSQAICTVLTFSIAIHEYMPPEREKFGWIPATLYILLSLIWSSGIGVVAYTFLSELFPIHGRTLCCALVLSFNYLNGFFLIKTYYNIKISYGLWGVFGIYGLVSLLGSFILYIIVPETEGYTLDEIEHMLDNKYEKLKTKLLFWRSSRFIVNN